MRLVLASSSSRRRDLLERLNVEFDIETQPVDESRKPGEPPGVLVERLAREKASSVAGPGRVVIAADTIVVHEGRVLGKPSHPEEARSMLRGLQGDRHEVFTAVAVCGWADGPDLHSTVDVTEVVFLPMTEDEVADYVAMGEPMDKAGAYALQGEGGLFVEAVVGSPFTVIGLPIHLLARLMAKTGHSLSSFRKRNLGD